MALTAVQREARRHGIGASVSPIIMGASNYSTPFKEYLKFTDELVEAELDSPEIVMGNLLEHPLGKRYEMRMECKVRRVNQTLYHPEHKHILCHLDRKIVGRDKFIEIKTANFFAFDTEAWGEESSDVIPEAYMWQVQHQLAITGYQEADLVVFPKGSRDIKIYCIKRDDELISILISTLNNFWFNHVLAKVPPPLSNRDDVTYVYPRNNGNYREVSGFIVENINKFKSIRGFIKDNEAMKKKIEMDILEHIGDCDGMKDADGKILATWKADKNGNRVLRIK